LPHRNTPADRKCLPLGLSSSTKHPAPKGSFQQYPRSAPGVVHVAKPNAEAKIEPPIEQHSPRRSGVLAPAFHDLGVDPACLPGLVKMGIIEPSPIQKNAVQQIISGANVAIQSYTGSGKTLAYLLPAITLALKRAETVARTTGGEVPVQVVVAAPNQELAMQIVRVAQSVLPDAARKMVQQCIGGANINNQTLALERNRPIIVVGTPGRLAQLMRMGALRVHRTPLLVLDEADQLLAPHFTEDMYAITTQTGKRLGEEAARAAAAAAAGESAQETDAKKEGEGSAENAASQAHAPEGLRASRQTVMASATLTESVLAKTAAWCPSPLYTTAGGPAPVLDPAGAQQAKPAASPPEWGWGLKGWDGPASAAPGPRTLGSAGGVEQAELVPAMPPQLAHMYIVTQGEGRKADTLRRAVHALDLKRVLVFMNFQQRLKDFQFKLEASKMKVATLHGELSKVQRQNILNDFRRNRLRALMVSDLVARGLDVAECDAVFNGELPSSAAHYAHRAGRTGRMGAPGSVISLVTPSDVWVVDKLARRLGVPIQEVHVADGQLHQGPPPRKFSTPEEANSSRAARGRTGSPSPSSFPAPEGSTASSTSVSLPSTSTSDAAQVPSSRKSQPAAVAAAAAAAAKPDDVLSAERGSSSSGGRKKAARGAGMQNQEHDAAEGGSEEVRVIVDDEDEWEVDEDDQEWEGLEASSSGRGSRVQSSSSEPGRRDAQVPGLPLPKGSRAARRALKFGRKLPPGFEAIRGAGDGHANRGEEKTVVGSEGMGSSKVKEDLIRELMALREEKAAVKGTSKAGARRKGTKASRNP